MKNFADGKDKEGKQEEGQKPKLNESESTGSMENVSADMSDHHDQIRK